VRVLVRTPRKAVSLPAHDVIIGDIFDTRTVERAVQGVRTIVHVPPVGISEKGTENERRHHRRMHVESTEILLKEAAAAGVEQFLFVSSVHAGGQSKDRILCEFSATAPATSYGKAKLEAEDLVRTYGEKHAMRMMILRPPGIYGSGDRSVVGLLRRAAERNLWLPLKSLRALHSLIFVDDLARAGLALLKARQAASQAYIIKDPVDYIPAEIYAGVCRALGKRIRMFSAPAPILRLLGQVGARFRSVPVIRLLAVLEYLVTPQRYCDHLFRETLPEFMFVGLEQALGTGHLS